jgi:hypothetical protein
MVLVFAAKVDGRSGERYLRQLMLSFNMHLSMCTVFKNTVHMLPLTTD